MKNENNGAKKGGCCKAFEFGQGGYVTNSATSILNEHSFSPIWRKNKQYSISALHEINQENLVQNGKKIMSAKPKNDRKAYQKSFKMTWFTIYSRLYFAGQVIPGGLD